MTVKVGLAERETVRFRAGLGDPRGALTLRIGDFGLGILALRLMTGCGER